jgi:hypothetical protein
MDLRLGELGRTTGSVSNYRVNMDYYIVIYFCRYISLGYISVVHKS